MERSWPKNPKSRQEAIKHGELWEAIEEEWDKIEAEFCMKLISTMPKRIQDVFKAKGGYTNWWNK